MDIKICGKYIGDKTYKKRIEIISPSNLQVIDSVPEVDIDDIDKAIRYAYIGYQTWSCRPLFERIEIIRSFADLLEKEYSKIAEIESHEMGKPIVQAENECRGASETIREIAEHARTLSGEVLPISNLPSAEKDLLITIREPYGVVAAIIPFNYPISQCVLKVIPALLMGNSVIIKPASEAPLAVIKLVEIMYRAGVPDDVVQIVTGYGNVIGKALCEHELISVISITGSTEAGIKTSINAAPKLKKVLTELGGNDPFVVLPDADIDYAVSEAVIGRYGCNGQICCGSKRFIVHEDVKQLFIDKLINRIKDLKMGDPLDRATKIGPLVSETAARKTEEQIMLTVEEGGKILLGGRLINKTYIEPTVIDADKNMSISRDMEVFAPVWPIISYKEIDEAIEIANQSCYGLSAGCIGTDYRMLLKLAKNIEAGCVVMNGCGNYQTKDQGFGGVKMSGNAHEGGHYALEEFSRMKTIVFRKAFEL